jgi:hypothetical protein
VAASTHAAAHLHVPVGEIVHRSLSSPRLPRDRPQGGEQLPEPALHVRIKGNGTEEQFAKIHDAVMATSPNFYSLANAVVLKPTLVIG